LGFLCRSSLENKQKRGFYPVPGTGAPATEKNVVPGAGACGTCKGALENNVAP